MTYNEEYKKLVEHILVNGAWQEGRNGNTLVVPSYSFTVKDMENDHILKLRKIFTKGIIGEFNTLIDPTPLTNISQFEAHGCNYWSLWAKPSGELNIDYHNKLHPQLEEVIEGIRSNPSSRRHVINLWDHDHVNNPEYMKELSLPNCWHNLTFSVINNTLHLNWVQRSVDTAVGLPSDVFLAYLFMNHVAHKCDLAIGSCMFSLSNVHLYEEHIPGAKKLLTRTEADFGKKLSFELKA